MPNVTDNYKGYEEGDLSKHADQLRDKQFLLVSSSKAYYSFILEFQEFEHNFTLSDSWNRRR